MPSGTYRSLRSLETWNVALYATNNRSTYDAAHARYKSAGREGLLKFFKSRFPNTCDVPAKDIHRVNWEEVVDDFLAD